MKKDNDHLVVNEEEEEQKIVFTNKDLQEEEEVAVRMNLTSDMQGVSKAGSPDQLSHVDTNRKVTIHADKTFKDVIANAERDKQIDLDKMKQIARDEEKKEVEILLNLPQPSVPKCWDYLILPRKINI
jgi:hypothetical protein